MPEVPMPEAGPLPERRVGGLTVSAVGLGCMGMAHNYGRADEAESVATINRAIDLGVTLLDTADVYGGGANEHLVGRAIRSRRDQVVLASKFGMVRGEEGSRSVDGRPEYVKACCEASLRRLGLDTIDLYYQHRVDPDVPIEDTVGAMAELRDAGKIRYLGLSEAGVDSLERAAATATITALQSEWSLWARDLEGEVVDTARRLGIGIVAYSPLGRGFLTGTIRDTAALDPDDMRHRHPRFVGDNLPANLALVNRIRDFAAELDATPAQAALAWALARGKDVVPIVGTTRRDHLEHNLKALALDLGEERLAGLDALVPSSAWQGERARSGPRVYGASTPGR